MSGKAYYLTGPFEDNLIPKMDCYFVYTINQGLSFLQFCKTAKS